MKSVSQARKEITQSARPLVAESVPLEETLDRVIAKAERAKCTKPAHDVSAMDGFALNGGGKTWHIMGKIAAGDKLPSYRLRKGEAMHISTGAPLPKGADRILIKEDATFTAKKLTAKQTPKKDIYIRKKASDFWKGQKLFSKGMKLTPPMLSLAAAAGISKLTLHRRPKIALLSNGNELVSLGTLPKPHQSIASANIGIKAMIKKWGAVSCFEAHCPDRLSDIRAAIRKSRHADILITIGGASIGDHDFVRQAAQAEGIKTGFWKIAMKPGKPLFFGKRGNRFLLGLPGNPVSALLCAELFLSPLIKKLSGLSIEETAPQKAKITKSLPANGAKARYLRGIYKDGALTPLIEQDSACLSSLIGANCWIIRPPHAKKAPKGKALPYIIVSS